MYWVKQRYTYKLAIIIFLIMLWSVSCGGTSSWKSLADDTTYITKAYNMRLQIINQNGIVLLKCPSDDKYIKYEHFRAPKIYSINTLWDGCSTSESIDENVIKMESIETDIMDVNTFSTPSCIINIENNSVREVCVVSKYRVVHDKYRTRVDYNYQQSEIARDIEICKTEYELEDGFINMKTSSKYYLISDPGVLSDPQGWWKSMPEFEKMELYYIIENPFYMSPEFNS